MAEYPKNGEVFELTLDGAAHDPLEMVRRCYGYTKEWRHWWHTGAKVVGIHTRRFELVSVGYGIRLEEVRRKLEGKGEVPGGQWIQAFKQAYPEPDGKGPVGVADPAWVDSADGFVYFPYVDSYGNSYFCWAGHDFDKKWRWLVALSPFSK